MMTPEECCCDDMFNAISSVNEIPINLDPYEKYNRIHFNFEFVDTYDPGKFASLGEIVGDTIAYCPFCGEKTFSTYPDKEWEKRKYLCEDFLEWFMKDEDGKYFTAPTPMFKFDPKENKFYMHYRKGFGEGWIPVKYCIYCGEPLSEMVEKHGLSKFIADQLDPSEWQGKYKLCKGQKKLRDYKNWPNFYT